MAAKKPAAKKPAAKKTNANSAFNKLLTPSADFAEIVGSKPLPRTQVMVKVWEYIKKNGLQDAKSKKQINPDAAFAKVVGKAQIDMFKMVKKFKAHLS